MRDWRGNRLTLMIRYLQLIVCLDLLGWEIPILLQTNFKITLPLKNNTLKMLKILTVGEKSSYALNKFDRITKMHYMALNGTKCLFAAEQSNVRWAFGVQHLSSWLGRTDSTTKRGVHLLSIDFLFTFISRHSRYSWVWRHAIVLPKVYCLMNFAISSHHFTNKTRQDYQ